MRRALFVSAAEADIMKMCAKHNIAISDTEPLPSGGTRLVLKNAADADAIAAVYGKKIMDADTPRTPTRLRPR